MNERIKQMAIEAGLIAAEPNGFDPTSLTASQLKFAELIVDDCTFVLLLLDLKAEGQHNYYKHAKLEVEQHFGC